MWLEEVPPQSATAAGAWRGRPPGRAARHACRRPAEGHVDLQFASAPFAPMW